MMMQTQATKKNSLAADKPDVHSLTQDLAKSMSGKVDVSLPDFEMIELIFFGYRDFIGEPDRILDRYQFGRAHHRILHFVHRHPGLTIAALLDILAITKQSLARVLKDLVDHGYVEQRSGTEDRRQRLLFLTPKGLLLETELLQGQHRRISAALAEAGPEARPIIERFLMALVEPASRSQVRNLMTKGRG
jgi:DNA-binding MarR family transcriptional regulator